MAAKYHCDVCLKEFDYKYRYERHVETTSHKDKSHSPSAIASDELSLAIGDVEHWPSRDEAEKDSDSSSDSDVADIISLTNSSANKEGQYHPFVSMMSAMAYIIINSLCSMLPGYHAPEKFYSPSDVPFYHVEVWACIFIQHRKACVRATIL
ncbi:hypothetical protein EMCRGX_G022817 [Ephydatia muelleri]